MINLKIKLRKFSLRPSSDTVEVYTDQIVGVEQLTPMSGQSFYQVLFYPRGSIKLDHKLANGFIEDFYNEVKREFVDYLKKHPELGEDLDVEMLPLFGKFTRVFDENEYLDILLPLYKMHYEGKEGRFMRVNVNGFKPLLVQNSKYVQDIKTNSYNEMIRLIKPYI